MPQHTARFTWGAGAQTVCVAGNFNNWSADASPLHKQPDGSFAADIPVPWGEKQAFKYVVDGDWKVREDEAKEWDAAGNMNNVYTAPPAPISTSTSSEGAASSSPKSATAGAAAVAVSKDAPTPSPAPAGQTANPTEADKPEGAATNFSAAPSVPPTTAPDTAAPTESKTKPSTLIASSAPGAASGAPVLGGPIFPTSRSGAHASPTHTTTTEVVKPATTTSVTTGATSATSPATTSSTTAATTTAPAAGAAAHHGQKPLAEEPINVQIDKVAAKANIGEAPTGPEEQGIVDKASDFATGALAAIGAVVGNAAVAVENLTGVDIAHTGPLSVTEAKAQGIDVKSLEKKDAETDTTSPVGTAPPASAVTALEEKVQELKVGSGVSQNASTIADVPLPQTAEPKTSLAPPGTVTINEKPSEAKREHDIPAQSETTDNHQIVPQPSITTITDKDPKKDRTLASTSANDTAGTKPISHDPAVDAKAEKAEAEADPIGSGAASDSPLNTQKIDPGARASNIPPKSEINTAPAAEAPSTPSKTAAAPATPAKNATSDTNGVAAGVSTPAPASASAASTPASTPAKSTHTKEQTSGSDVRKRKSSLFTKIKHAFSPKDKEKSK